MNRIPFKTLKAVAEFLGLPVFHEQHYKTTHDIVVQEPDRFPVFLMSPEGRELIENRLIAMGYRVSCNAVQDHNKHVWIYEVCENSESYLAAYESYQSALSDTASRALVLAVAKLVKGEKK